MSKTNSKNKTAKPQTSKPQTDSAKTPLIVAAIALFAALLSLLLMLANATALVTLGLTGHIWYITLLLLGLSAAISLFYLFKSYARYSGKVFGGKLELGGPGVLMLTVVGFGFWLVPQPGGAFNMTVFVEHHDSGLPFIGNIHDSARARANNNSSPTPMLMLDIGADRRQEAIGAKGEVHFLNIPEAFRGQQVAVKLSQSATYQLPPGSQTITLNGAATTLKVQAKQLTLRGEIHGPDGKPIANARVQVQAQTVYSDNMGHFSLSLPANLPITERHIIADASGFNSWRGSFVLGGNRLIIQLQPQ